MSDIESRFAELALQVSTLKGHWDNGLALIQKLMADSPRLKADLDQLKQNLSNHQALVTDSSKDVAKLKSLVATVREEFSRNMTTEIQSLLKNIESKHSSIAALADDHSSKIAKFESLIEGISLDAKNAALRANNAEMMVVINKKKVDNVHLMLKNQQQ